MNIIIIINISAKYWQSLSTFYSCPLRLSSISERYPCTLGIHLVLLAQLYCIIPTTKQANQTPPTSGSILNVFPLYNVIANNCIGKRVPATLKTNCIVVLTCISKLARKDSQYSSYFSQINYTYIQINYRLTTCTCGLYLLSLFKGARTYCIINERDQPAAKEEVVLQTKTRKTFLCIREWDFDCIGPFYYTCSKKQQRIFRINHTEW